ncbi:hypothetical protein M513_10016 [Trichuris suis]|uniref:Uncharacterized protein n=1 Tax=Trichuris suis TaxID=68888 RepID=A0A085LVS8_9BILA|nr:hypothetical protein M513_10016 [Trichuris suis]
MIQQLPPARLCLQGEIALVQQTQLASYTDNSDIQLICFFIGITHERPSIAARDLARNLLPWMFLVIFLSAIGCTTYYYYHTVSVTSQCQVFMEY